MPIWDYKCNKCNKELKDKIVGGIKTEVFCECGEKMERQPNLQVNVKWNRLLPAYMPPPQHIVDNPRAYYE